MELRDRIDLIHRPFLAKMMAAYSPPQHVQGDEDNRRLLLTLLSQAAAEQVPETWDHERVRVFGERLWKAILGVKFGIHWPTVDQVAKAATEVVVDMQAYDALPRPDGERPVPRWFPDFWRHSAQSDNRHPSQSPYMVERRRQWEARFGNWPLGEEHDGPPEFLGEEPDFMGRYPRLRAQVDALPDTNPCKPWLAKLLTEGLRRHQVRYAQAAE